MSILAILGDFSTIFDQTMWVGSHKLDMLEVYYLFKDWQRVFVKIATCQLRTQGQSDLSLCKGYEEGNFFLHEFLGAMQAQSFLIKFLF